MTGGSRAPAREGRGAGWRVLLASCLLLVPSAAQAQGAPQMQTQVDVDTVGVGDVVHLELTAQSGDAMPTDPRPGPTPGFTVRGQSASPSQTHISINGNQMDRFGLTVDWALQAQRIGMFTVGPPSLSVGGVRYASRPVTLRVVAAGQAPQRAPQQQLPMPFPQMPGFSPFDPWRSLFPGADPGAIDRGGPAVTTDPKLALDAPGGPFSFLHASVDTVSAVVGQQVTLTVYEYLDEGTGTNLEVDATDARDPSTADLVKHSLLRDDQDAAMAGYANVGGRLWKVNVVRRWALFPIHAGDLVIGPMSVTLVRPRSAAGSKRTTEAIHLHVTEPPVAGRPSGYAIGDVGHFALQAQVSPRDLEQGGAVGVHVELSGSGNLPASITPPVRTDVEWLAPEVHDQMGDIGHDTYGGKRTFDYVVRVRRAGQVDLGEMSLPFWEPAQKGYAVARATLGKLNVKPTPSAAGAAAGNAADQQLLAGLPPPRNAMEGTAPSHIHIDDRPLFWWLGVGGWPAVLGIAVAGRATHRRLARTWRARRVSPATELRNRVTEAHTVCAGGDARACDAAIVRALESAAIAHAGVNVRGAVGVELVHRLQGAGVAGDAAALVAELLRECEAARFAPDAVDLGSAQERWQRAQGAIRQLEKR
jgi:hypothetical protein